LDLFGAVVVAVVEVEVWVIFTIEVGVIFRIEV